ncbi:MAG: hypothetical protein M3R38_06875 [Actinomycetota bacterium]|nr:hypothetical protein [Actinomycetota bacterium]
MPDTWLEFGPVRVFLDDLEEIDRVIRRACGDVRLEVDGYVLDGLADLTEVPGEETLKEVQWLAYLGSFEQRLTKMIVTLSSRRADASASPELRGPLEEVGDVLRRSRRRLAYALSWGRGVPLALVGVLIGLLALLIGDDDWGEKVVTTPALLALPFLLSASWTSFAIGWRPNRQAVILRSRRGQDSFWRRNKDAVWLVLLGALAGAVFATIASSLAS